MSAVPEAKFSRVEAVQFKSCKGHGVEIAFGPMFRKTKLCKFFAAGQCLRGSKCTFAHGQQDLAPLPDFERTTLCPVFTRNGACPNGDSCKFAHGSEELRPRFSERVLRTTDTALGANEQRLELVAAEEGATSCGPGCANEQAKLEALQVEPAKLEALQVRLARAAGEPFAVEAQGNAAAKPLSVEDQASKAHPTSIGEEPAAQWWSRATNGAAGGKTPLKLCQLLDDGEESDDDGINEVPCWVSQLSQASTLSVPGLVVKNTFIDLADDEADDGPSLPRVSSAPNLRLA